MRTVAAGSVGLLILGLTASPAAPAPSSRVDVKGVTLEARLDKAIYSPGELVGFALAVTNRGTEQVTFQFPTGQMFDFVVTREAQQVWQWSRGRVFTQALTTLSLSPGETKTFADHWDQRDARGQEVPPGVYEMAAIFPAAGGGPGSVGPVRPRVQFTIRGASMPSGSPRTPVVTSRPAGNGVAGADVLVGSQVALRIRAAAGDLSASRRAEIVAARLRLLFAKHLRPAELAVVPVGTEAAIVWRRQLVVTVGPDDAREAKTTPIELAREWLRSLTQALPAAP